MFKFKKVITTVLTIAIFLSSTAVTQAFASTKEMDKEPQTYEEIRDFLNENANTEMIEINELDYMKQLQSLQSYSKEDLIEAGYTVNDAEEIINYDFNTELFDIIQNLSVDEFKARGYTNSQIKKFKEYDGTIDAIEYLEINALSSATLTVQWAPYLINNKNQFRIIYNTEWNTCPIFTYKDLIGICWVAANASSVPLAMKFDETPTLTIRYYEGTNYIMSETISATSTSNSRADFGIVMSSQQGIMYAKMCSGSIKISTLSDSNNMSTIAFAFCYGHTTISIGSPSLSYDTSGQGSISITPSWQTENTYNKTRVYKYDGTFVSET